jgi:hypothetical protein
MKSVTLRSFARIAGVCLAVLCLQSNLRAGAIDVSYSVSGSSGSYVLDFSVTNNMVGQNVYFFGVDLSAPGITGSPAGFDPYMWASWNNVGWGSGSGVFNNNWIMIGGGGIGTGLTQSGFQVTISDLVAPTGVDWFAYGINAGSDYPGGDPNQTYHSGFNPGFEGTAGVGDVSNPRVPDSGSVAALLGLAGVGLGLIRRQRQA